MRKKLIINYIIIILVSIGITAGTFGFYGYTYLTKENEKNLISEIDLVSVFFEQQNVSTEREMDEFIQKYAETLDTRLTFITEDGTVLSDSEADPMAMENHSQRPEVVQAFRQETGVDRRYSQSLGVEYYYAAVVVETDHFYGVIRASEPAKEFRTLIDNLTRSVFVMVAFCFAIAMVQVYFYTKSIMDPIEYMTKKAESISNGNDEGSILVDGDDEVARLARSFNTMTRSLNIEKERVISRKEELDSILKSMNSCVVAMESNGNILFYNAPFAGLIGYEDQETGDGLLGQSFYQYFRNEDVLGVVSEVEEMERPVRRETQIISAGQPAVFLIKGTPIYKNAKRKYGTLLILEDVTRMKKLETMRKDFVSNVSHELKTPLTSIRGFVETLKEGAIEDPRYAGRFLDIIDIEAERLSFLVQDILTLSEIESGKETGKSMVSVEQVIDDVIELLEKKKKDKVEIRKEVHGSITDYWCNGNRLKQLIINLVDNGMKYTNEGSVTIRCWEDEKDLILQFEDTGVGIPKEHLPRLFERFYRVDKGRSRKQGGTGLGLSIVKHIVEAYHGTVTVESQEGEGSIFTVRLPYYVN